MNSRRIQILVIVVLALVFGAVVRPLERSARAEIGREGTVGEMRSLSTARLSQGMSLALLGGYRPIVANMVWISMNNAWRKRDFDTTLAHIKLATSIDPRHEMFWLNGARIIANDMPAWRMGRENIDRLEGTIEGSLIKQEFGAQALALLREAVVRLPDRPRLWVEMGVIEWYKMGNLEGAAEMFLEASKMPDAPYFVGRIYAEILERLGRKREALSVLKEMLADLPAKDPMAMVPVVKDRIRRLEEELGRVGE